MEAALQTGSYGSAGSMMRDRAHTISGPSPRRSHASSGRGPFLNAALAGATPATSVASSGSFSSKAGHSYMEQVYMYFSQNSFVWFPKYSAT